MKWIAGSIALLAAAIVISALILHHHKGGCNPSQSYCATPYGKKP